MAVGEEEDAALIAEIPWRAAIAALRPHYQPTTLALALRHFRQFEAWCQDFGRSALPAQPETVRLYVAGLASHFQLSSIRLRVGTIRKVHLLLGHADPTQPLGMRMNPEALTPGAPKGFVRAPRVQSTPAGEADWIATVRSLEGAYAPKTIRAIIQMFREFEAWCRSEARESLPASAETVAAYVEDAFRRVAASGIETRLSFIRKVHALAGRDDPTRAMLVQTAFRRGLRTYGSAQKQATGMTAAVRDQLRSACPATLLGLRDRAMISLGYDTLCRAFELVALRAEDLVPLPDGTAKVRVRRTKGSLHEGSQFAFLSAQAAGDVRAWLTAAGIRDPGPILRPVARTVIINRQMEPRVVRVRIRLASMAAGLPPDLVAGLSGHSMRVGAAQDLAVAGRTLLQIMRAGRWRSIQSVALYAKAAPVNVWAGDPGGDADAVLLMEDANVRRELARRARRPSPSGETAADDHESPEPD
ncbi:tyrosine-type recombinase/integrase [Phenylobacterium sp. J367]|uniref:tyrosine-type recombinase/integrase n=1 Tax=Phenylobacterium sp. J367 TaxID=2898435 RepID=UPI002150C922|nr:tyrosine-type recombinase/integrase [Phenylobacterium sp. J367]MCR5879462.1 tyrosine-type recombinase/integrase [Phenylobacterium sp. J367]